MSFKILHPVYRPSTSRPTFSSVVNGDSSGHNNFTSASQQNNQKPTHGNASKSQHSVAKHTPNLLNGSNKQNTVKTQRSSAHNVSSLSNRQSSAPSTPDTTSNVYRQFNNPSLTAKARFDRARNSHVPLWGDHTSSHMGHRPLSSQETYRLTRKSVPKPPSNQELVAVRKTQSVSKDQILADPTRAGVRTGSVDNKRSLKKRVSPPRSEDYAHKISVKIIPEMKYISDPIAQISERYHVEPKPQSLKTFEVKPTQEDESHFQKAGSRPHGPNLTNTQTQAAPIQGGGFFPETAKPGLKYHTSQRPVDNTDVFQYKYSGGISNSNPLKERQLEKQNYENLLRTATQIEHASTKEEYMYYKTRKERPSIALTEFCYPDNIKQ